MFLCTVACGFFYFLPKPQLLGMALLPLLVLLFCINATPVLATILPEFAEPIPNVTVPMGREAVLTCVVNHLGKHKVAWVKVDTQTILTIHHHVITRNYRIFLTHSDYKYWYLHINNVQESDRGYYMCQVNTVPMRSVQGYVEVVVPPNIMDNETSSDMVVKEGDNVTLFCHATGYPQPHIRWQRDDNKMIPLNSHHDVATIDGEVLTINRVSRVHMGAYLCIADNGIPPAVSKRIVLKVHFPPMIWIPHQRMVGIINSDVTLECHTEAYPKSINYWTTDKGEMITSGDKFTAIAIDSAYQMHMRLIIHQLSFEDFGSYRCIAKNSLGETSGSIRLLEVSPSTPLISTSTDRMNFKSKDYLGENKLSLHYTVITNNTNEFKFPKDRVLDVTGHPTGTVLSMQPRPHPSQVNNCGAEQLCQLLINSFCLLIALANGNVWSQ